MTVLRELAEGAKVVMAFFAPGRHVLDFSHERFDVFSAEAIGCGLCSKYGCSDGEALRKFDDA